MACDVMVLPSCPESERRPDCLTSGMC